MSGSAPLDWSAWERLPYVSPTRIRLESHGRRDCALWRVEIARPDYTRAEWLACWGPYPGPTLELHAVTRYAGARDELTLTGAAAVVRRVAQASGKTLSEAAHRVVGRYEDRGRLYLVTEPVTQQCQ